MTGVEVEELADSFLELVEAAEGVLGCLNDRELTPDELARIEALTAMVQLLVDLDPSGETSRAPILAARRAFRRLASAALGANQDPAAIRAELRSLLADALPDFPKCERPFLVMHVEAVLDEVLGPQADRKV
jgi:hypothetical protein